MNDTSLAENVVIVTRIAAMRELAVNVEIAKSTLQSILEFDGRRMEPTMESTSHAKYGSQEFDQRTIGKTIPLRSPSNFCFPTNPWPKSEEPMTKKNAFAFTKRKSC